MQACVQIYLPLGGHSWSHEIVPNCSLRQVYQFSPPYGRVCPAPRGTAQKRSQGAPPPAEGAGGPGRVPWVVERSPGAAGSAAAAAHFREDLAPLHLKCRLSPATQPRGSTWESWSVVPSPRTKPRHPTSRSPPLPGGRETRAGASQSERKGQPRSENGSSPASVPSQAQVLVQSRKMES